MSKLILTKIATPPTPASTKGAIFMDTADKKFKSIDDAGLVTPFGMITLNSGDIYVGNASNIATDVAMSGDITIDNTGATTIGANKVNDSKIIAHTTTKITTTSKSLLNAQIVYTDQTNTFGAFNQLFKDANMQIVGSSDATKILTFSLGGMVTGTTITISSSQTGGGNKIFTIPTTAGADTFVMNTTSATLANKILINLKVIDALDSTKQLQTDMTGMTTGILFTLKTNQSTAQTLTIPNITGADTLMTLGLAQTVTGALTATGLNAILMSSSGLTIRNPANTFTYTVTAAAIVAARVINLPLLTADDTMTTANFIQTLTNKKLDSTNTLTDATDTTKQIGYTLSGMTTGIKLTLSSSQTTAQTLTIPNIAASSIIITDTLAQTISGAKTFSAAILFTSASPSISRYNNIVTAGVGVVPIFGSTLQKAETGTADANVLTYTPPATAGSYRINVSADVSSATSGVIGFTLSYTDSNGNALTNVAISIFQTAAAAPALTFTTSVVSRYYGTVVININNAAAGIIVKWVGGGTTAAKVSALIEQVA
jgi:hypothetical protein